MKSRFSFEKCLVSNFGHIYDLYDFPERNLEQQKGETLLQVNKGEVFKK